jgi:hypothetical protein
MAVEWVSQASDAGQAADVAEHRIVESHPGTRTFIEAQDERAAGFETSLLMETKGWSMGPPRKFHDLFPPNTTLPSRPPDMLSKIDRRFEQ